MNERKGLAMKFIAVIFGILLLAGTVQAQQVATTTDGKKVILNADGTWKYSEASPGVTLKIEAGLVYRSGDVKPVARSPFALLALDPRPELMRLPRENQFPFNGIQKLEQNCWRGSYPEARAIIREHAHYTFTTGFDGKAELRDIVPGKYWLYGQPPGSKSCIMWIMEVDLTKDQSLTLDQNNAID